MGKWKQWVVFVVVVLVSVTLDLGTKYWASRNLATPEHQLPLVVGESDAGKTLEQFLRESRCPEVGPGDVMLLPAPLKQAADAVYPVERVTLDRGYVLFDGGDRTAPPHYIYNPALKEFYEQKRAGKTAQQDWKASWTDRKLPWVELIDEALPFYGEEAAKVALVEGYLHPVPMQTVHPPAALRLEAGDVVMIMARSIEVVPGFYNLIYAENPGAAWGFLRDAPLLVRVIFLEVVSLFAMGLILVVVWKTPTGFMPSVVGLAMIMGGAIGNFVDRFSRTVVVDFLDMYIKDSHWPTYNVADIAISVGVALLFIQVLRKKSPF